MFNVNRSVTASLCERNGLSLAEKRILAHLVADKIVQKRTKGRKDFRTFCYFQFAQTNRIVIYNIYIIYNY